MYFINKKYIIGLQIGQQTRKVTWLFNYRTRSFLNAYTQFIRYNPAKRSFTQTRRAMKQYMVQRFTPNFGSFNKYDQVLNQLRLTGKIIDFSGPNGILKLPFGGI